MSQRASGTAYSVFAFYAIMQKQFFSAQGIFSKIPMLPRPPQADE
jgi:hypothetical protein